MKAVIGTGLGSGSGKVRRSCVSRIIDFIGYVSTFEYGADSNRKCIHMTHLDSLNVLIDKASAIAGSDYKLAQSLDVPRQHISNWRHGKRTATPADQALMAHIAGLDPVQVLARATVEQYEGKAKGDALMKALGKASLATGAVLGSAGAMAHQIFGTIQATGLSEWAHRIYTQCAVRRFRRTQYGLCQAFSA